MILEFIGDSISSWKFKSTLVIYAKCAQTINKKLCKVFNRIDFFISQNVLHIWWFSNRDRINQISLFLMWSALYDTLREEYYSLFRCEWVNVSVRFAGDRMIREAEWSKILTSATRTIVWNSLNKIIFIMKYTVGKSREDKSTITIYSVEKNN
jgi:hypothetical protein